MFLLLGGLFLLIGVLLVIELRSTRVPPPLLTGSISLASLIESYAVLLRRPWSRVVLATVCAEAFLFYGAFTFVGAYLHTGFGLDYARVGMLLGFMGLGGLLYALTVRWLVQGLGERGLARYGGLALAGGFVAVAISPLMIVPPAMVLLGLGLHMLHNTLQTNATQMAPEARGLAVSTFANVLFMGQAAGIWLSGASHRPHRLRPDLHRSRRGAARRRARLRAPARQPPRDGLIESSQLDARAISARPDRSREASGPIGSQVGGTYRLGGRFIGAPPDRIEIGPGIHSVTSGIGRTRAWP